MPLDERGFLEYSPIGHDVKRQGLRIEAGRERRLQLVIEESAVLSATSRGSNGSVTPMRLVT